MSLNTFFCRQGVDTSLRFLVISGASLCLIYLFSLLFAGHGILLLLALPLIAVSLLSASRRLITAQRLLALAVVPGPLLLAASLVFAEQAWPNWVALILSILAVGFIVSRPQPKTSAPFDSLGYSGPLMASNQRRTRVEPTLAGDSPAFAHAPEHALGQELAQDNEPGFEQASAMASDLDAQQVYRSDATKDKYFQASLSQASQPQDRLAQGVNTLGEQLAKLFGISLTAIKSHPRGALLGFGCLSLLLGSLFWLGGDDATEQVAAESEPEKLIAQSSSTNIKQVAMPDGFKVQLEGKVLMLSWLGERGEPGTIWSLASAEGDSSCKNLTFNNGVSYRPMTVSLLADTSTQARFSPLDTPAIINDIAMRGSLTLCGYEFSLKGSQAALAKEPAFRPYL
ncbi:hypothetical protein SHLO109777_17265 [Shewanella loihica]|uniref:Uncharacterized protein n=1 Tax=Shewanella loihica (strain ATCC BAA-1088 / PV-4) TaxID=323850 RepID=A3QIR4_SHELP|nr:hypothetical protein [Shewanella loihica]ABO25362.1 conserved hypothetical protein [Shewanella loihica PV-4]